MSEQDDKRLREAWIAYDTMRAAMSRSGVWSPTRQDLRDAVRRVELEARIQVERLALEKEGE